MLFRWLGCGRELDVVGIYSHQTGVQKGAISHTPSDALGVGQRIGNGDSEAVLEYQQSGGDDDVKKTHGCLRDEEWECESRSKNWFVEAMREFCHGKVGQQSHCFIDRAAAIEDFPLDFHAMNQMKVLITDPVISHKLAPSLLREKLDGEVNSSRSYLVET